MLFELIWELTSALLRTDRIADRGRRLDRASLDWVLIMTGADKAVLRVVLIILCMVAFVPVAITALAQIMRLEARRGYRICQRAVVRSMRRYLRARPALSRGRHGFEFIPQKDLFLDAKVVEVKAPNGTVITTYGTELSASCS